MEIMPDYSEIVHYEQEGLPFYARTNKLSCYPDMSAPCHWHDNIEWIHVLDNKMYYYVNEKKLVLNKNDCLIINARQMHCGHPCENQDCEFSCVLFHPSLFCSNRLIMQKYVTPILENPCFEYLHFTAQQDIGRETAEFIQEAVSLKNSGKEACELEAISVMQTLWCRLLARRELLPETDKSYKNGDLEIQKSMVSFIYQHYGEKLTLNEIAASGHVSRSKCCLIFKRYLHQSPIDFLNCYRLKASYNQLCHTDKNISEIAYDCGFNHLSYFSRLFADCYGCTPRECRRNAGKA